MTGPRVTRARRVANVPGSSLEAETLSEQGQRPVAQVQDVLDDLESEGQRPPEARIERQNDMGINAHLDTVNAEGVDEKWIRNTFGGGTYTVRFFGQHESGVWGYLKGQSKRYVIDTSIPFKGSVRDRAAPVVATAVAAPAGNMQTLMEMGIMGLFKGMQDQSAMQLQMFKDASAMNTAMLERLATPKDSGGIKDLLPLLTPLLTPLLAGMMNRKDPVEIAKEIAALSGRSESGMKDMLGTVRELLEVRELLGTGGNAPTKEPEEMWIDLLGKVVPGALDLLKTESAKTARPVQDTTRVVEARLTAPALSATPTPVVDGQTGPAAQEAQMPVSQTVVDEWTPIEPYVTQLAGYAAKNRDPHGVMMTVVTFAPDEMVAAIRELVGREDAATIMTTRFPLLAGYQIWTAQLINEFREELIGMAEEGDAPDAPAAPASISEVT